MDEVSVSELAAWGTNSERRILSWPGLEVAQVSSDFLSTLRREKLFIRSIALSMKEN